jgi:hypothetical protein
MSQFLYLYGIFPAPGPQHLNLQGLDAQPVETHAIGDFVFLCSAAQQERYLASRKNLLGHEKVLEAAMQAGYRTLLPLQFGLVTDSWEKVEAQLIRPHGAGLERLFARLEGQREVGVKVLWQADEELNQLMAENDILRHQRDRLEGKVLSMEEVVTIGQAIEAAIAERKQAIVLAFRAALTPLASAAIENDPMTDTMIFNAAYLIPWETEPQFGQVVESLDAQFDGRLRIRYNNFTAPFNFAQLEQLAPE